MKKWTVMLVGGLFLSLFGCLNVEFDENGKTRNLSLEPLQSVQPVETIQSVEDSRVVMANLASSAVLPKESGLIARVWEIDGEKTISRTIPKSDPKALFVDDADKFSIETYRKDPATATVRAFHIRESGLIELKKTGKYTFTLSVPMSRDRNYSALAIGGKKTSLERKNEKLCTVTINVQTLGFYDFDLCLIRGYRAIESFHPIAITVREPGAIQNRPLSPSELFHVTE